MGRVVQDWIARPFHPELDRHLRAGVSCSYCKFARQADIFPEIFIWRESRRREASGERRRARTGQGAQARVEERGVAQNLGRGGAGRNTGGGSDMIQFVRRPKSLGRNTGRFGQTPYRIQPPEGPKADTTNHKGFQNH